MVDYRIFDRDKFTIVGNPSITDDGIASGFSATNKIRSKETFNFHNKTFSIKIKFKQDDFTTYGVIFSCENVRMAVAPSSINKAKLQAFIIGDNGTIASYASSINCAEGMVDNYTIFSFDGQKYSIKHSLDDINYQTVWELAETESPKNEAQIFQIGSRNGYENYIGQVDLPYTSIIIDGVEVFSGSHLANTAEKLQYLKDSKEIIRQSIEAKGVEVPIETPFRQYADKIREIPSGGGSSRNRYLEFIGSPSSYPEVTDGILKARLNTKSLSDNIISSSNNLSSDDINTVDIVIPITFNNLTVGTDNNIFFGSYQTSTTNGFCLGINRTNNKLGLWVMNNSTWVFRGEQSTTSDAGETSLTLETNKKYYIRLQMNRLTSSTSQYIVSYKNNISDDFIEVFNKTSNRAIIGDWNTVTYGSTTILGIYFYCDADIDVKNATLDINTNTTRIVRIGD